MGMREIAIVLSPEILTISRGAFVELFSKYLHNGNKLQQSFLNNI